MRLLDLFCGAGGAATGYALSGFDVVGVDRSPQPNFPYEFIQANALDVLADANFISGFDAIHASPPCQAYSTQTRDKSKHERLIPEVRQALQATGKPYVIENVEGARSELIEPVRLCGSSFGLDLRRHRYFESNVPLVGIECNHAWQTGRFHPLGPQGRATGRRSSVVGVYGSHKYANERPVRQAAMRIGWMSDRELTESIPPLFTEFLGRQLFAHLHAIEGRPVPVPSEKFTASQPAHPCPAIFCTHMGIA